MQVLSVNYISLSNPVLIIPVISSLFLPQRNSEQYFFTTAVKATVGWKLAAVFTWDMGYIWLMEVWATWISSPPSLKYRPNMNSGDVYLCAWSTQDKKYTSYHRKYMNVLLPSLMLRKHRIRKCDSPPQISFHQHLGEGWSQPDVAEWEMECSFWTDQPTVHFWSSFIKSKYVIQLGGD